MNDQCMILEKYVCEWSFQIHLLCQSILFSDEVNIEQNEVVQVKASQIQQREKCLPCCTHMLWVIG